ncbi:hypothetical protein ACHAWF_002788 [Thalassiosira exigua]
MTNDDPPFDDDVPFDNLPPDERIAFILRFIHNHKKVVEVQTEMYTAAALEDHERSFWPDLVQKVMDAIREQPSLATAAFSVPFDRSYSSIPSRNPSYELPLMHLLCRLDCGLPMAEAVYASAGPESLRLRHAHLQMGDSLPLHCACACGASTELIEFLVRTYPGSIRERGHGDQLPLQIALSGARRPQPMGAGAGLGREDFFDEEERKIVLFRLLSESLNEEELLDATREIPVGWDKRTALPLALIRTVATLHDCKSVEVAIEDISCGGCRIVIERGALVCKIDCDNTYDFALEQILMLPLPLKVLDVSDLFDKQVIHYFVDAIDPPQEVDTDHPFSFGFVGTQLPPPLDLSSVETLRVGAIIESEEIMMSLMKGLRNLPNLSRLHLSGLSNRMEAEVDLPLTKGCLDELAKVASETRNLRDLSIKSVGPDSALPFAAFLLAYEHLEHVGFEAYDPLNSHEVKELSGFLTSSKAINTLRLGPMKAGDEEHIVNSIKDNRSVLKSFTAVGEFSYQTGNTIEVDTSDIRACLTINRVVPQLLGPITSEEAYTMYQEHLEDTPVLYALLRCRPELWCHT